MAEQEFKLDTRFSDRPKAYVRPLAALVAVAGIALIILSVTTGLSSRLLPMEDKYLNDLVPQAPDGAEPLSLKSLQHQATDTSISISGTVGNRTQYTMVGLQAVIDIKDKFGFQTQTVNVPLEPKDVPAGGLAAFQTTIMVPGQVAGYAVRFQLIDGPFVPHKDEHAPALPPPEQPRAPAPQGAVK